MIFDQLTRAMQRETEVFGKLNEQLTTGKKINKPSDDVLGMKNSMGYRLTLQNYEQFTKNSDQASTEITFTEVVMSQVTDTLQRLSSLVNEGVRTMNDASERKLSEERAKQMRDQLLDLSNTQFGDRYLFSGFKTDTQSYNSTTYDYQGDSGVMNVMIDKGAVVPVNVPGSKAFSPAYTAPTVVQVKDAYIHYTPGAGTTTNVEIRASDDTTVLDSFSFSNVIQMADLLSSAINAQDIGRIEALRQPLDMAVKNVINLESVNQLKLNRIDDQKKLGNNAANNVKAFLSKTEDADITEVITEMQKSQVALSAMQISSSRMLQQSLMDFLK